MVRQQLQSGRLKVVLDAYAAAVPGFFIYFPSRAQRSGPLRLFVDAVKELALRRLNDGDQAFQRGGHNLQRVLPW